MLLCTNLLYFLGFVFWEQLPAISLWHHQVSPGIVTGWPPLHWGDFESRAGREEATTGFLLDLGKRYAPKTMGTLEVTDNNLWRVQDIWKNCNCRAEENDSEKYWAVRGTAGKWVKLRCYFKRVSANSSIHFVPWFSLCLRSAYTYFLRELILSLISKVFSSSGLALALLTVSHHLLVDCISLSCYHPTCSNSALHFRKH